MCEVWGFSWSFVGRHVLNLMNRGLLCLSHCWFPGFGRRWLAWHDQVPWSKDLLRGLDQKDLADWMWVMFCQFVIFSFGTFWWHFRVPCSSCLFFFARGLVLWFLCFEGYVDWTGERKSTQSWWTNSSTCWYDVQFTTIMRSLPFQHVEDFCSSIILRIVQDVCHFSYSKTVPSLFISLAWERMFLQLLQMIIIQMSMWYINLHPF